MLLGSKKLLYKTPNSPTVNEIFPNGSKNNEDISKQLDSNPIHVSGLNITTVEVIENTTTSTNLQNNNNFSLRKLRHLVGQNRNGSPIVYDNEEDTKCVNNTNKFAVFNSTVYSSLKLNFITSLKLFKLLITSINIFCILF